MQACLRRKNYRAVRCSHSLRRICRQRCDLQYVWYRTLLLAPDMVYKSLERIVARRNLRVAKWLGIIPAVGVCTLCNREFKVPLSVIKRVADSQESLRLQFAAHKCKSGAASETPPSE